MNNSREYDSEFSKLEQSWKRVNYLSSSSFSSYIRLDITSAIGLQERRCMLILVYSFPVTVGIRFQAQNENASFFWVKAKCAPCVLTGRVCDKLVNTHFRYIELKPILGRNLSFKIFHNFDFSVLI